jgi:hypothetical protein
MTLRASALCGLLLLACSSDGEAGGFVELGIEVQNDGGERGQVACEVLPVLQGSRRYTEHVIEEALTITVFASSDEARLAFSEGGRTLVPEHRVSRDALAAEYEETFQLAVTGAVYTVTLSSECSP